MTRFLHSADLQIGRLYSTFDPDHAPFLAEARQKAVERLASLAFEHQVDAVLLAGDIFDAQTVSDRTIRRFFNALGGYTGPWIMISGNHDAALAESVWTRAVRLNAVPPNAHLLLQREVKVFESLGFAVLPAPLTQRHTYDDLTRWFDQAQTPHGLLRIGLAHGSIQGLLPEDIDSANPIAPDRVERAMLDYLALGDWHGVKIMGPRMAYSGTPEPDRFKDNGAGQALLVAIDAPGAQPEITPLTVGEYRWLAIAHEMKVESDLQVLVRQLEQLVLNDVVDLKISGRVGLASWQQLQDVLGKAEANVRYMQTDTSALQLEPSEEDIEALHADGYMATVLADLRKAIASGREEAVVAREALALLASEWGRGEAPVALQGGTR